MDRDRVVGVALSVAGGVLGTAQMMADRPWGLGVVAAVVAFVAGTTIMSRGERSV